MSKSKVLFYEYGFSFPFIYFIVFPIKSKIYLENISFPYPYDPLYFSEE